MSAQKKKVNSREIAKTFMSPTVHAFTLDNLKGEEYGDVLDMLFHEKEWTERIEKRNRLYHGIDRMPEQNRPAAIRALKDSDTWLGYRLLQTLVMKSVHVGTIEHKPLKEYYAELPKDKESMAKQDKISFLLNATVFLCDIIESKIKDVNTLLRELFNDDSMGFEQMDGVLIALRQMSDFFEATRDKGSTAEKEIFADYAESIEKYMDGRMKTYFERIKKIRLENSKK